MTHRLDEVSAIFHEPLQRAEMETGATKASGCIGDYQAVTVSIKGQVFVILGITQPDFAPQVPEFVQLLARRARSRKVRYLVISNQRETLDQTAANRFVDDTWRKLKLPPLE